MTETIIIQVKRGVRK